MQNCTRGAKRSGCTSPGGFKPPISQSSRRPSKVIEQRLSTRPRYAREKIYPTPEGGQKSRDRGGGWSEAGSMHGLSLAASTARRPEWLPRYARAASRSYCMAELRLACGLCKRRGAHHVAARRQKIARAVGRRRRARAGAPARGPRSSSRWSSRAAGLTAALLSYLRMDYQS